MSNQYWYELLSVSHIINKVSRKFIISSTCSFYTVRVLKVVLAVGFKLRSALSTSIVLVMAYKHDAARFTTSKADCYR